MRHKYLPRAALVVLGLGAGIVAGTAMACSDPTAPTSRGPHLVLALETPPSDSLGQLAVGLTVVRSDSAYMTSVRIYVDSGPGVQPLAATTFCCNGGGSYFWSVVPLRGPGRHTVAVVGVDTLGRTLGASATWTVRVAGEAYTLAALPDSGNGAGTRFVHANGTVTGWVGGGSGRRRPAVWRDGALRIVGASDSLDGTATRVNGAGDILLEYRNVAASYLQGPYVRVLRADGTTVVVPPTTYTYPTDNGGTYTYAVCCNVGADLTETRIAVAAAESYQPYGFASTVFDVARGVRVDSAAGQIIGLNNAGQSVEEVMDEFSLYNSTYLVPHGFKTAGLPNSLAAFECDRGIGRYSTLIPLDLDESADVIASYCGNPVWLPPAGGTSRWLDRLVGPSKTVHLSRTGQIVASLDPTGTIYLWRAATGRTTQLQIAGTSWTIDSLAAVNGSGQIAAHGFDRVSGRAAALLLTPAAATGALTTAARR